MKKLLIIIDWFAPGYKAGGPIQSIVNLVAALKNDYEVYVLTTDTDHGEKEPYPGIKPNCWISDQIKGIKIYYAKKSELNFHQVTEVIKDTHADYIYLNLLFSPYFSIFPLWLKWTGKIPGKIIICPRGCLYDSALSLKAYKKKPLLKIYKWIRLHKKIRFHATNSREEQAIVKYFPGSEIIIADNLPNLLQPVFASIPKISGELKCIFIARIVPIKNLLFLLNVLKAVKATIELTIIGPVEDNTYWNECKNAIELLPRNITARYLGAKQNHELPGILMQHHLFILPTTGENFGHAIFESFLNGRPVLISDQTPWLQLEEKETGWDVSLHKSVIFTNIIEKMAGYSQQEFDNLALSSWRFAKNFIENPLLKQPYYKLFHD